MRAPPPARRGRGARRLARNNSDLSASEDEDDGGRCRECVVARNGFRCGDGQAHVGCHTCGKLIAQRDDPDLHQCCAICTTYYCNLYFPPCKPGTKLHLLADKRAACKIDAQLMRGNNFEFEAIRNYLVKKKQNSMHVFDYVMRELMGKGKFHYIMDRKVMKNPPLVSKEVKMSGDEAVCDLCWPDLWFQMVLSYRFDITPNLPSNVKDRPTCYWGINCRTMDHNRDHAQRYNHCVYQTRF